MPPAYLAPEKEAWFPNLRRQDYHVTSDEDWVYNCIAYAADQKDVWWWPDRGDGIFWPEGVPLEETLDAFVAAYGTVGYEPCAGPELEPGFEKVALYADAGGTPTHAAKQLPSGVWTSKLGEFEDIEHQTIQAVSCPAYGRPVRFLRREINESKRPG